MARRKWQGVLLAAGLAAVVATALSAKGLAFAQAQESDQGLRYQALLAYCRKADAGGPACVAAWYPDASPEVRFDILNAVGQGGNPVFLTWVSGLAGSIPEPRLKAQAQRASDLLQMAENRRKLGLKP